MQCANLPGSKSDWSSGRRHEIKAVSASPETAARATRHSCGTADVEGQIRFVAERRRGGPISVEGQPGVVSLSATRMLSVFSQHDVAPANVVFVDGKHVGKVGM